MAIDNLALETIASDLQDELSGAFFDKPFALGPGQFAFPYHAGANKENGGRGTFIICMNPSEPFVAFSFDKFAKVSLNTPFFNSLKKLAGCQVKQISKLRGERILIIETSVSQKSIETLDSGYDLIIELFPQRPDIYLLNQPTNRIFSMYKDSGDVLKDRYMSRGLPYLPPQNRLPLTASVSSLDEALTFLSRSTGKLFKEYSEKVSYQKALQDLLASRQNYLIEGGIEPFSFGLKEAKPIKTSAIYGAFVTNQKELAKSLSQTALNVEIKKALNVAIKKKEHLEEDLKASKSRLVYMTYGQEIFLHQTELEKGQAYADLDGCHIVLDKAKDPVANANAYFKKYRKAKSASEILGPLILKTEAEISYLSTKLLEVEKGTNEDILQLKGELAEEGFLKADKSSSPLSHKRLEKAQPHYLVSPTYKIGFGMNAYQNEELTFNIAKKDDLFLHVKDSPGSHVVILEGDSQESEDLAAELALYLSDLQEGDIMLTKVSKVKKNHEKRGLVNLLEYKTVTLHKIRPASLALFNKELHLD